MSEQNPFRSNLDQNQILQRSFNEDTDRLRVDAEVTASIAVLEVDIDALSTTPPDNILIVGSEDGTASGIKHVAKIDSNNDLHITGAVSQLGSWTVTANAGTGNFTVVQPSGSNLHVNVDNFPADSDSLIQNSATLGQLGSLIMGAVTTNAPSYTNANTNPLSLDTSGLLRISLKDTPSNTNKFLVTADPITFASPQHVIVDSGTITANIGTTGGLALDSTLTSTNTKLDTIISNQTNGTQQVKVTNLPTTVDTNYGTVGSSTIRTAAQIGNSTGAALFGAGITTTQVLRVVLPTDQTAIPATQSGAWTTGRTWSLSSGTDSISAVQSTSPWVTNVSQFGGNNVITGTGASGVGIPRVTVSNDSNILATQSGTWTVQQGGAPWSVSQGTTPWIVSGQSAVGTTPTNNPVSVSGIDGGGLKRAFLLDTSGRIEIDTAQSLPLPTGASTSANQTNGLQKTQIVNGSGTTNDFNYGAVGTATIRVASQPGNATGAADFNAGVTGAQTPRVTANITRNGTELSYNAGTSDANTIRTAANLKREGTDIDYNYGTVGANTIRVASQVGNATGASDFGAGNTSAQTLRTADNMYLTARTTAPTTASNGNYTSLVGDPYGQQVSEMSLRTRWGQSFTIAFPQTALTGTTEVPLIYINNPNGSGKSLRIKRIIFGPTLGNNYCTYAIYLNPTVTANGTAMTINGLRQTGQNVTVASAFSVPTVSANGTFLKSVTTSGLSGQSITIDFDLAFWLEANNKLLITRDLSANATIGGISIEWVEE